MKKKETELQSVWLSIYLSVCLSVAWDKERKNIRLSVCPSISLCLSDKMGTQHPWTDFWNILMTSRFPNDIRNEKDRKEFMKMRHYNLIFFLDINLRMTLLLLHLGICSKQTYCFCTQHLPKISHIARGYLPLKSFWVQNMELCNTKRTQKEYKRWSISLDSK